MVPYRIYKMSDDNHIIGLADEIEFDSDQDAIKHAKTKLDGLDLEVWRWVAMAMKKAPPHSHAPTALVALSLRGCRAASGQCGTTA